MNTEPQYCDTPGCKWRKKEEDKNKERLSSFSEEEPLSSFYLSKHERASQCQEKKFCQRHYFELRNSKQSCEQCNINLKFYREEPKSLKEFDEKKKEITTRKVSTNRYYNYLKGYLSTSKDYKDQKEAIEKLIDSESKPDICAAKSINKPAQLKRFDDVYHVSKIPKVTFMEQNKTDSFNKDPFSQQNDLQRQISGCERSQVTSKGINLLLQLIKNYENQKMDCE